MTPISQTCILKAMTLKNCLVLAVLLLFAAPVAHAQNPQDETVFMQCSVAGRDGQVTVSFKHEVAIYRFGPIGQPSELELFSPYTSLQKYYPSGHDIHEISEIVAFQNADYTYAVTMGFYDGWIEAGDWDEEDFGKIYRHTEGDEEFGSVVVHQDGVIVADLSCRPESIQWNRNALFDSLLAAGYEWGKIDSRAPVWYDNDPVLGTYPYSGLPRSIAPFSCPYTHEMPIFFTTYATHDLLSIKITGNDCDTADVILTITTQAGEVVHHSAAQALSYTYEYQGADGVRAMLMRFLQGQPKSGHDIPADIKIDTPLLKWAERQGSPLFCHQAGKSYSACFVYADGRSNLVFTTGS